MQFLKQRDDIRDNLKEAIEDYVVSSNSPNYQSDVNNAVEGVQTTVSFRVFDPSIYLQYNR